jgi:hypothetical protein
MAPTMKAVRYHGKNDLRYEDIPIPPVEKGQVKVLAYLHSILWKYIDMKPD